MKCQLWSELWLRRVYDFYGMSSLFLNYTYLIVVRENKFHTLFRPSRRRLLCLALYLSSLYRTEQ